MRADYEYGAFLIVIEGETPKLKVRVWDKQIQRSGQPLNRLVCEVDNLESLQVAKKAAADCIAAETGRNANSVRSGIQPYKLRRD
jgi:hypothetical protein